MFKALVPVSKLQLLAGKSRAAFRTSSTLSATRGSADLSLARQRRLDEFLTAKGKGDRVRGSSLRWSMIKPFYKELLVEDTNLLPPASVDAGAFSKMLAQLDKMTKLEGSVFDPRQLKQSKSLAVHTVIDYVTEMFGDEFQLAKARAFKPTALRVTSRADYGITRHNDNVVLIDVKRMDILQGQTQLLMILDAASIDGDNSLSTIWGITSTYEKWVFYKYTPAANTIVWSQAHISKQNHHKDVVQVAQRVYSLLLDVKAEK